MGVQKRTRKFAQVKRVIGRRDNRIQAKTVGGKQAVTKKSNDAKAESEKVREIPQLPAHLFFESNQNLGPPYHVILDTNFWSQSVRNKIDILPGLMDALLAKCIPVVTDCTIAELEKLGRKFVLALRLAKDERWQRYHCDHSGTYADECIVSICQKHRCYLVGTNDKELRQRLRKIPGVPLVAVARGKYVVERLPELTV